MVSSVEHLRYEGGSVIIDARYFPVVVSTWSGISSPVLAERAIAAVGVHVARAVEQRIAVVVVSDTTGFSKLPPLSVRQATARRVDDLDREHPGGVLRIYAVVDGAVKRGVAAAILWLFKRNVRMETVATTALGLRRALETLRAKGIPPPEGLDPETYVPPIAQAC